MPSELVVVDAKLFGDELWLHDSVTDERVLFYPNNHNKKRLPWNGGLRGLHECLMALFSLS